MFSIKIPFALLGAILSVGQSARNGLAGESVPKSSLILVRIGWVSRVSLSLRARMGWKDTCGGG